MVQAISYKMEPDMWKEERKEWAEHEEARKKERAESEKKRVEEMERFKSETRENLNSVTKSVSDGLSAAVKSVTEEVRNSLFPTPLTISGASPHHDGNSPGNPHGRTMARPRTCAGTPSRFDG